MVEWRGAARVWRVLLVTLLLTLLACSHYATLQSFMANIRTGNGSSSSSSSKLRHARRLAQALQQHIAHVDASAVSRLLAGNSSSSDKASVRVATALQVVATIEQQHPRVPSPFNYLADMLEDVSAEAQHIITTVFHYFAHVNGDGGVYSHPLTNAYRHQRYKLASRFLDTPLFGQASVTAAATTTKGKAQTSNRLQHDALVYEVYAAALSCEDVVQVDARVALVTVDDVLDDTRLCVRVHAQRVLYAHSRLRQVYMQHHHRHRVQRRHRRHGDGVPHDGEDDDEDDDDSSVTDAQEALLVSMLRTKLQQQQEQQQQQQRVPPRIVAPPSTVRSGMWLHPLNEQTPLLPGVLPPPDALIMHPGAFVDLADALFYYVFGVAMEHVHWRQHACVVLVVALWCLLLLASAARQAVRARRTMAAVAAVAAAAAAAAAATVREDEVVAAQPAQQQQQQQEQDVTVPAAVG